MKKGVKQGQVWVEARNIASRFLTRPRLKKKRGQVWVETVIYTLIALTIIGLFLSFAQPKIKEIQDKAFIEQSVSLLEDVGALLQTLAQGGPGNQRVLDIGLKKGTFTVDSGNDSLIMEISGLYSYTEPGANGAYGAPVMVGNVLAKTKKVGKTSTVILISNYSNMYNITYQGSEVTKVVSRSPAPYHFVFLNNASANSGPHIDISLNS